MNPQPIFLETPAEFRAWLEKHYAAATELWVGFHRKASGRPSMTWPQSVDEALCFGWIDGIRKSVDTQSYMIRFTPRKTTSTWSAVNIGRVAELTREGRMHAAGLKTFAGRVEARSGIYAYEQREHARLSAEAEQRFRAQRTAWEFFQAQPAWYRKTAIWKIVSAKRPDTREKRLATLIADSAARQRIRELRRSDPTD